MHLARWRYALAVALLFSVGLPAAPPAAAMMILGGGAVIVVNGTSYCTLTTIGSDRHGDTVGFTGSVCGGPGSAVTLAGTDTTVGTVVATNDDLHYAVIKFDVPELIPVSDYAGIVINGIGPDPEFDSTVCKWGPATPGICNRIMTYSPSGPRLTMRQQFQDGDVGAPVTMDGRLVGLVYAGTFLYRGRYSPHQEVTYLTKFSAILADLNAGDGPGSGFVPVGS